MDDMGQSSVTAFRGREAPETSAPRWQQSSPSPEAIALLTTCLALVRPVGFTDDNARDWLRVAAGEIAHLPLDILHSACSEARRTATHHAQIVPAIIKAGEEAARERNRIDEFVRGFESVALPAPPPWRPEPDELEAIKAQAAANLSANR